MNPRPLGPSSQHALIVDLCLRQRRRPYGRLLLSPKKRYSFYSGTPVWFGTQEVTGNPVTLQHNKKRQGKTLSFLLVEATGLEPTTSWSLVATRPYCRPLPSSKAQTLWAVAPLPEKTLLVLFGDPVLWFGTQEVACNPLPQQNRKDKAKTLSFPLVEATGLEPTTSWSLVATRPYCRPLPSSKAQTLRSVAPLPEKTLLVLFGDPCMVRDARGHGQPRHSATQQKKTGQNPIFFVGRGDGT